MKTVYCLRTRLEDSDPWQGPDYYLTRKRRDTVARECRCLFGIRTHSYEEKYPDEQAKALCSEAEA